MCDATVALGVTDTDIDAQTEPTGKLRIHTVIG